MADIKDLETYFNEVYGPVADWMTDFDHANPAYNENAHALWDEMRDKCPVAHTTRYGGTWLPVTMSTFQKSPMTPIVSPAGP